ncbi:penicillin acylase [Nocardioides sp. CF8]|uniref:penicillin acylase family protein n=1 Tax=Nocardioides sp. CF8 TaxID=110319 RepID=UPI00032DBABA|nr:penicillin acylase family protein [Nocardioides sp. CF8]EON22898.1 penicillin acylase [Nocardioides sp. CF8]
MRRWSSVLALSLVPLLAVTTLPPSASAQDDDYGYVRNILPPGENGTIDATDLLTVGPGLEAQDGKNAPPNFADQLEMYDELTTHAPYSLDKTDLGGLFKSAGFTPEQVVREESPRAGVAIQWDQFGVPYITGTTYGDVMFGSGYAAAMDRMFLMDALRHTGSGRLAEFAGGTPGNVAMDAAQHKAAFYTEEEATAQIDKIAGEYGAEGQRLVGGLDAYLAGINAGQDKLCPAGLVVAPTCPVEYALLGQQIESWDRADVIYIASLVGGIFGRGGGGEADNAAYLQKLTKKFGKVKGRALYRDLRTKLDADAPTSASVKTAYGDGEALGDKRRGVALPDLGGQTAPGSGTVIAHQRVQAKVERAEPRMDLPSGSFSLRELRQGMSNALLIGAKESATGKPVVVFGPQTGYFTPQLLNEQVLMGPGVHARGVSFAGTNLVVQLGRGIDYAWSATSASLDNVDTVAERLCNVDGSKASVESEGYLVDGTCVPMTRNTPSETVHPSAGWQGAPATYTFLVLRTRHGIVQERTTVDGVPVALVAQRSTYGREVASAIGFARLNNPDYVKDAKTFQRAAHGIDYTFNWFYADNRDIAYFASGRLPRRAKGTAFDFPRWGDRRYDWRGWLGFDDHVREINPERGYLVSWNNRQSPKWGAPDNIWGWGSVHRSDALEDKVRRDIRGSRKVSLTRAVGIMADAATQDTRATSVLPWLLKVIGKDRRTTAARAALKRWARAGAPRVDRDRDGAYAHQQAIALFDTWWEDGEESVAYDVMGDRLGVLARDVPGNLDDHPRAGTGSAWMDPPYYSYLNKDLRTLLGDRTVREDLAFDYCGRGSLKKCRQTVRTSLRGAVTRVLAAQGVSKVADLTYDKSIDAIRHSTSGAVGVRDIDWQNRPTFQQVVAFERHRPR